MRGVWLSGLTAAALLLGLMWHLSPLEPGVVALQLAFTPRAFGNVIHSWSSSDLALYRSHLPADGLLLIAYGTFGYLWATRTNVLGPGAPGLRRFGAWLLPAAALFDAGENALHWWLTEVPRFGVPLIYAASATFSVLKWLGLIGFAALAAYALARTEA